MRIDSWNADDFVNTITVDHVDPLCIKCVCNAGKNHRSEVFEDKQQFL